jgi:hypothetical protein
MLEDSRNLLMILIMRVILHVGLKNINTVVLTYYTKSDFGTRTAFLPVFYLLTRFFLKKNGISPIAAFGKVYFIQGPKD